MSEPQDEGAAMADPAQDAAWHEMVTLRIGPHPGLSIAQRKALALDYGMTDERLTVVVRRALLFYALRRLGLNGDPSARAPEHQHIVLVNAADVLPKLTNDAE
jgi:hypothetical protein